MTVSSDVSPTSELVSAVARPRVPLGVIVAIACIAQFMGVFQESVVAVGLPAMREQLGLSTTDQAWVVNAYMITFGGLLLLAARASDLYGRKKIFVAGLAVFVAAGIAAGAAQSSGFLIGALFVQGIGAAAVAPASLSLITASHPEGPGRTRALTIWSTAATSAAPIGLVVGGVLTSELSWRWGLLLNVLLGGAMLVAASLALASRPGGRTGRAHLDLPGSLTVTLGAGAVIYGVSEASTSGWSSGKVVGALAVAAVSLAAFVVVERRIAAPLVPFGIFRNRSLTVANLAIAASGVALTAQFFFVSLYLQQVVGFGAARTGAAMIPMSAAMIVGAVLSKTLVTRVSGRLLMVGGGLVSAGGVAWLADLPAVSDYPLHVLGPTAVLGIGIGLMILPMTEAATSGVPEEQSGLASGLFNVTRQIGGAVGLAVLVTIATTTTEHSHHADPARATVQGFDAALVVCAVIVLVGGLVGLFLPAGRAHAADDVAEADAVEALVR